MKYLCNNSQLINVPSSRRFLFFRNLRSCLYKGESSTADQMVRKSSTDKKNYCTYTMVHGWSANRMDNKNTYITYQTIRRPSGL